MEAWISEDFVIHNGSLDIGRLCAIWEGARAPVPSTICICNKPDKQYLHRKTKWWQHTSCTHCTVLNSTVQAKYNDKTKNKNTNKS